MADCRAMGRQNQRYSTLEIRCWWFGTSMWPCETFLMFIVNLVLSGRGQDQPNSAFVVCAISIRHKSFARKVRSWQQALYVRVMHAACPRAAVIPSEVLLHHPWPCLDDPGYTNAVKNTTSCKRLSEVHLVQLDQAVNCHS
jgi:hypothetical protein